ncbi:sensor histidine kinase [Ferruginibacter sp. SUN106]|uniref:sensor histidine kinase n=1 Tax=Ferruginibacter sp. SUN106 TaxID=2978348 RepID=UPI003D35C034
MATGKKQFIFFHVIGILIFLCLPVLFLSNGPENKSIIAIAGNSWFWLFSLIYIGIFYLNAYWLFPHLYLKKHYLLYITTLLVLLLTVYFIQPFDHIISLSPPPNQPAGKFNNDGAGPPNYRRMDFVSIFLYAVVVALSILIPVVKQWQKTQQQFVTAQKDKANAELSFLKAQINPHFLFNTLNNLYSLSLAGSDKTPESIMRLSKIMRYVTDETQSDFVLLENEIQCINDFIELQKLRLNSKTTIVFSYEKVNDKLLIAPLILLPFVENIFKHGISNNESSTIEIKIAVKQREILFYCRNNIFNHTKNTSRQGTGIANVTMRLQNVYPGKHFLKIEEDGKVFEVHLIINT